MKFKEPIVGDLYYDKWFRCECVFIKKELYEFNHAAGSPHYYFFDLKQGILFEVSDLVLNEDIIEICQQ